MTLRELYRYACERLAAVPVDAPAHEALLLCEHFLGISGRLDITISGDSVPNEDAAARFCAALEQRAARPLQYILGEWDFCGMTLAVGEGVLVPRDDTAVLVDAVCEYLSGRGIGGEAAQVIDLCAGSGAVILAIKRHMSNTQCRCVELSDEAMVYLKKNVERYGSQIEIIRADVLAGPQGTDGTFDVICSNPPYIPAAEIEELGREVRQEPRMALDGGEDGLEFYRAIGEKWSKSLKPGGYLAVEVGAGQAKQVGEIFARCGLTDIRTRCDINGIERVVSGVRKS